jgi:hypothetical protein
MPKMLSLRSFRLATLTGHVVQFVANEPKDVPDAVVKYAMEAGCVPVNKEDVPYYDDTRKIDVEFQGDIRRSIIWLVIDAIATENDPKKFDGGGLPKHEVICDRLGYTVARDEIRTIYQLYLGAKQNNREFVLHPAAQNVRRVVDAESKAELLELAAEFGLEEAKIKALSSRDLRKTMLQKFGGTPVKSE